MDELTLRYREACEQDDRRPSDSVREAVHAHARMMIAAVSYTHLTLPTIYSV